MLREPKPFTPADAPAPAIQKFVLSRERFEQVPEKRGRYIVTYILIFAVWGFATINQFYFETTEVPVEAPVAETIEEPVATPGDEAQPIAATATEADGEPQTRTEYRWKRTWGVYAFQVAMVFALIFFYTQFVGALTLMGYPFILIMGYCAAVFLPIPGILAVAVIDQQIAKAWNRADDAFQEAERLRAAAASSDAD